MSNTPIEKRQFYIEGAHVYDDKKVEERVLAELVNRDWLKEGDEKENERRVTVLKNASQYSMATVAIQHSEKMYPYLHSEGISMEFNSDSDYGLEMRYSVPYSDGEKRLFTLECQLFLGKDFELNEVQSRVYYHFEKQCPREFRCSVNFNSIMEKILDWLKELFTPNSYAAANTMSPPKNEYKGWVPPFVSLTKEQYDNDILEANFKIENEYYEDDPHENVGIGADNIHQEGYKDGYKYGSAEGYKVGVEIGSIFGETNGFINSLATQQNDI
ncbi:TPA: hypothetical protein U5E37_003561 [Yersinia enterocolitica]|nr:hypothetical protein [Yersinia enterocolitica]HEN3655580.1 hypothetical protein [Yersinia enterocolitica]HEN3667696.1 hypothetical protein [Yersinia enterocolitica]